MTPPDRGGTAGSRRPKRASSPTSLNVSVYLPEDLADGLRAERSRVDLPYTAILAAAFERTSPEALHEHLHRDALTPETEGGMPPSSSWHRTVGGTQVQLRMSAEQRDWLDAKVELHNAPSRTALVVAVLELGLPRP